ncbi:hypothetical protein FE236_00300 [Mariprofundus erugo]|uniref:DUF6498-containing protein n=1 Tax=Mariprofundus erugo TaxID=2528639 RepID=UPI0010FDB53C|nr:DUF6498-containing protein [Mariprofundus erugo]TLS78234.1 hypothetical protein FE236_00300 [Mariprofundus erugo]
MREALMQLWRYLLQEQSAMAMVAVGLLHAGLALALGWKAADLLMLYWAENLVIGSYYLLRMAMAGNKEAGSASKLFILPFFIVHYGIFCTVHGLFLQTLLFDEQAPFPDDGGLPGPLSLFAILPSLANSFWEQASPGVGWALLLLVASHGYSFLRNYLMNGRYRQSQAIKLMFEPYQRIVVMHVVVILGALPVMMTGSPLWMLLLLILLKSGVDVTMHRKLHGGKTPGETAEAVPGWHDSCRQGDALAKTVSWEVEEGERFRLLKPYSLWNSGSRLASMLPAYTAYGFYFVLAAALAGVLIWAELDTPGFTNMPVGLMGVLVLVYFGWVAMQKAPKLRTVELTSQWSAQGQQGRLIPESEMHALQMIRRLRPSLQRVDYQLYLVLRDGSRVQLLNQGSLETLRSEAMALAKGLGVPLWEQNSGNPEGE